MRARGAIVAAGLLAACAGVARAQDAASTVDAKALCGLLATEPGEAVQTGAYREEMKKLVGDVPSGATCTVTIREAKNSKVALTLLGLPRGSDLGCELLDRARRSLMAEGLTPRPSDFRYGIRGVLFVETPAADAMLPLGMAALLACDGDFLLFGMAGAEAKTAADLDDEIELLRSRTRRAIGGVISALGTAPTPATSEEGFLEALLPYGKDFYARFRGGRTDCPTESGYRYCGEEEAGDALLRAAAEYPGASPQMRDILAMASWRYPSGELVAPSIRPVLPVIQRLAEKARTDPSAGVALRRFMAMTLQMDVETAGAVGTPTLP